MEPQKCTHCAELEAENRQWKVKYEGVLWTAREKTKLSEILRAQGAEVTAERDALREVVEAAKALDARILAANPYTAVLASMTKEVFALNDALRAAGVVEGE